MLFFQLGIGDWTPTPTKISLKSFLKEAASRTKRIIATQAASIQSMTMPPLSAPLPPRSTQLVEKPKEPEPKTLLALTDSELLTTLKHEISSSNDIPSDPPVADHIGKLMWPRTHALHHEAAPMLLHYAKHGCPVDCGENWSLDHILKMLKRGPHQSAYAPGAIEQLRQETQDKIKQGYARIVKWKDIKDNLPPTLKISPMAMIPHKSKKYRCILDLSFQLRHNNILYPSVNTSTVKKAPPETMVQLGRSLPRLINVMAANYDPEQPFYFCKLDIKDGFWRMAVSNDDAWHFCYVLPALTEVPLDEIELVVPNSLQMGWCESPPFFCAGTETARDVIQQLWDNQEDLPAHEFEKVMLQEIVQANLPPSTQNPSVTFEVYVDDFCTAAQTSDFNTLQSISRSLIHGIHSVFPPPSISKHGGGDPISEKKLLQGEGTWSTTKEILGWIFDGKNYTIQLPPTKCDTIVNDIKIVLSKEQVSLNKYQKLAGKLQHASIGIPGGKGLFSPLQFAMLNDPDFIPLTPHLKCTLEDWRYIIHHMKKHPCSVLQLAIDYPHFLGYSDACGIGVGGIWCSGTVHLAPFLWKYEWPDDIKAMLITDKNPHGTITINDLELAGAVLNWLALELVLPEKQLHLLHVGTFCDNTSAVAWAYKLRTSKSIVAGKLLRLLGLRIHSCQASGLTPLNIAGSDNTMADVVSRAFKNGQYFEANSNTTDYFNAHFPLPQGQYWKECILPNAWVSRVIACLRGEQLPLESLLRLPKPGKNTGIIGSSMPLAVGSTHGSPMSHQLNETLSSMHTLLGSGQGSTVEELKSRFKASTMHSQLSPRPSNWLDNQVPSTEKGKNTN